MPAAHIRVVATPNGGGFGGKSDPFNHEIVVARAALVLDRPVKICLDSRGGVPLPSRPASGADALPHRREPRRHASPGMHLQTLLDGGAYGSYGVASTFYTGALQTVTYQIPTLPLPGLPGLHQQAAVRTQARPRHAAEPLRPGSAARQDRRAAEDRPGRPAAGHDRAGALADRQLPARRHHRPGRVHPTAWSSVRAGARSTASSPYGRGFGLACSSYLSGAGLADLLERHAALGRAAQARSQRRRHRVLRRHRDRPGQRRRAGELRRRGARHRPVRHPRRSPATPISRRWISGRTPAASR